MTTNALLLGRMADGSGRRRAGSYQCQSRYAQPGALQGNDPGRPVRYGLGWHPRSRARRITPIKINTVVVRGQNEHEVSRAGRA